MAIARSRALMIPLSLTLGILACLAGLGQPDSGAGGGTGGPGYRGLGLEGVPAYAATFEVTFTRADDTSGGWSYRLYTLASDSPPLVRRDISMEGVDASQDLGDVTLTVAGDTQYMSGEAVGDEGCLVFPATVELGSSILTPDDLLEPATLDAALTPAGEEVVAGQDGQRYTFQAKSLGEFTDVSGDLVVAEEGDYVLRYDFAGSTVDSLFASGQNGQMTWHFEVTDFAPTEVPQVPEDCLPDIPMLDDAADIARLPGLVTFTTASSAQDVVVFYSEALPAQGWNRMTAPASSEGTYVLTYEREGTSLTVSVSAVEGGSEVQLFFDE